MIFRQATAKDAKDLLTITHTAFLRYAREVGQTVSGVTETYDDTLADIENKYVLLAIEDDKIVGAIRLDTIENIVYISRLCSVKTTSNINIGAALIEKTKELVDADALCLHTSTKIPPLVMFYYKSGFYINSISHHKGYPRGLFICNLTDKTDIDYEELTKNK